MDRDAQEANQGDRTKRQSTRVGENYHAVEALVTLVLTASDDSDTAT